MSMHRVDPAGPQLPEQVGQRTRLRPPSRESPRGVTTHEFVALAERAAQERIGGVAGHGGERLDHRQLRHGPMGGEVLQRFHRRERVGRTPRPSGEFGGRSEGRHEVARVDAAP